MYKAIFACLITVLFLKWHDANAGADNVRFDTLRDKDGLSQQSITALFQDSRGFIWVGTQDGLNRFDGQKFLRFMHDPSDPSSLSNGWVRSISEDTAGNIWVGTRLGLNIFNRNTQDFTHLQFESNKEDPVSDNDVVTVWKDNNHDMWIGSRGGIYKYQKATDDFTRFPILSKEGRVLKPISIFQMPDNRLIIATNEAQIFFFDPKKESLIEVEVRLMKVNQEPVNNRIREVFVDSSLNIWLGSASDGVFVNKLALRNSPQVMDTLEFNQPFETNNAQINDIYEDKDGTIWIASGNRGLFFYTQQGELQSIVEEAGGDKSLASNQVSTIMQDQSGVLWVGTFAGLNKWNTAHTKFDHFKVIANSPKSIIGSNITAIEKVNNQLYIASTAGLSIVDEKNGSVQHLIHQNAKDENLQNRVVMSIEQAQEDEVWFGYRRLGASKFVPSTGEFVHYVSDRRQEGALQAGGVTDIQKTKTGEIWLTTFGGGLHRYDRETDSFEVFKTDSKNLFSLSDDRLVSIFESEDGLLWIGSWSHGVNIFNPTTKSNFRLALSDEHTKSQPTVWAINQDTRGNIWIGTQGAGLFYIENTDFERGIFNLHSLTNSDGLPSNVIYSILESKDGMLWLSTNRGVARLDPMSMEIIIYTDAHGLSSLEFNSSAFFKDSTGRLYFGGTNGVTGFDPMQIRPSEFKPPVVITNVQKLNQFYSAGELKNSQNLIEFTHKDYLIGFEFAALDYVSPDDNKYRYRLLGFDNDWVEAIDSRRAIYTNLPAGDYDFQVVASNSDGVWNEIGTTLQIRIKPAPWASATAFAIYAIIILAILAFTIRRSIQRADEEKKYRETLELEVSERTKELQTLNQRLMNASITDQLTGLHNRRYLNDVLPALAEKVYKDFTQGIMDETVSQNSGSRLFFLMFDLDGFKPINDTYGHDAGDKVIIQVAELLKDVSRVDDIVIRWGGDEFLIVGQISDIREVNTLAERLRANIAACGFNIGLSQSIHLSSSIGFSVYPFSLYFPDALRWEQVHLLADNALYKSKDAGKNTWTGIVESPKPASFSEVNSINANVDKAIENSIVELLRFQPEVFKSSSLEY